MFQNTNQKLPFLTRALIALSDFLRVYGGFVLIALAGAGVAARVALAVPRDARALASDAAAAAGRRPALPRAQLGAPLRDARDPRRQPRATPHALQRRRGVVSNLPHAARAGQAAARVQEGASLARALGASRLFPPLMVHMIASGEASGRLGEMLERTAVQQARELERRIAAFVALLEPLLILAMGGVVLVIVMAILLPIFELNSIIR